MSNSQEIKSADKIDAVGFILSADPGLVYEIRI